MFKQLFIPVFLLCCLSFNVFAKNSDDPFAKNNVLEISQNASWKIDKNSKIATKSSADYNGAFYHLKFDNKQIELYVSSDAAGAQAKKFSQFEIKDIQIDGEQSSLFRWCLNNQERHNRFLQDGLKVKKDICVTSGSTGVFTMRLNKDTLMALKNGNRFEITIKPYRTPLVLDFDISDFKDMYATLNAKPTAVATIPVAAVATKSLPQKKCKATPPTKYKSIKAIEYNCSNVSARKNAEASVAKQVNSAKDKERKAAAEKEKQRKLAEEKKQEEKAAKLKKEQALAATAAAVAASEAKQAQIGSEISQKMIKVCEKYWSKGEHRCYCQKYIEHAPAEIQASSTCK